MKVGISYGVPISAVAGLQGFSISIISEVRISYQPSSTYNTQVWSEFLLFFREGSLDLAGLYFGHTRDLNYSVSLSPCLPGF